MPQRWGGRQEAPVTVLARWKDFAKAGGLRQQASRLRSPGKIGPPNA
jgi:hypothetical protein